MVKTDKRLLLRKIPRSLLGSDSMWWVSISPWGERNYNKPSGCCLYTGLILPVEHPERPRPFSARYEYREQIGPLALHGRIRGEFLTTPYPFGFRRVVRYMGSLGNAINGMGSQLGKSNYPYL